MKKILTLMMAFAVACCMAACGNPASNDEPAAGTETITIQALNANKEMVDVYKSNAPVYYFQDH